MLIKIIVLAFILFLSIGCTQKSPNIDKYKDYGITLTANQKVTVITKYILENRMNLVKDEYEKSEDFLSRVEESFELIQKAIIMAHNSVYGKLYIDENLKYDADNEQFTALIKSTKKGFHEDVRISVPMVKARSFKKNINNIVIDMIFNYKNKKIELKEIVVEDNNDSYKVIPVDSNLSITYSI